MRIVNWNVNSARTRVDRMVDFLIRHDVDVLAVQESKCRDDQFPYDRFTEHGYEVAHFGLSQWNGVAIISRVGLEDVQTQFPGQPGFHKDADTEQAIEARAIGAVCGGVRVWSLYVPNGREIADPHYDYKLRWLYALRNHVADVLRANPEEKLVLLGDYNIAPTDQDVWDVSAFEGRTHITEPERAAYQQLLETGLAETNPGPGVFTYWDYKGARFLKGEGMRIDFQLASPALAAVAGETFVDVEERGGKGASDHAPVIVDYAV
ncbi:Exodeoxyribonuclease III [Corynebacterium faecale]|uniref:exodeoxyribonuclease III n=1 Tax=Corynebacterium faecale TaxID=1758466 RepID=UPI0025B4351C|nr:exodeoxyribonuclease III [Corynebacterium faecale]WJY93177.1 Exodeoxyribonuclease III [Corynebacterium faecale]